LGHNQGEGGCSPATFPRVRPCLKLKLTHQSILAFTLATGSNIFKKILYVMLAEQVSSFKGAPITTYLEVQSSYVFVMV
jgi:hypothetical protein